MHLGSNSVLCDQCLGSSSALKQRGFGSNSATCDQYLGSSSALKQRGFGSNSALCDQCLGSSSALEQHALRQQHERHALRQQHQRCAPRQQLQQRAPRRQLQQVCSSSISNSATCDQRLGSSSALLQHAPRQHTCQHALCATAATALLQRQRQHSSSDGAACNVQLHLISNSISDVTLQHLRFP
jgi:hypothetical protein